MNNQTIVKCVTTGTCSTNRYIVASQVEKPLFALLGFPRRMAKQEFAFAVGGDHAEITKMMMSAKKGKT